MYCCSDFNLSKTGLTFFLIKLEFCLELFFIIQCVLYLFFLRRQRLFPEEKLAGTTTTHDLGARETCQLTESV